MKGKISEIEVRAQADRVTIDQAMRILQSAKRQIPNAHVCVIIYYVVKEREIEGEAQE